MVKRRASKRSLPTTLLIGIAAASVLGLFLVGEGVMWFASDHGRVTVWRWLHLGDRAHAVRLIGKRIETGLENAGVPRSALESTVLEGEGPALRWRIRLPEGASPLRVNHEVTRAVESGGAEVLSGREDAGAKGTLVVTMLVGVRSRPTHEVVIERAALRDEDAERPPGRLALVLLASTEHESLLVAVCRRPETFAVLAAPAETGRQPVVRAAHEHKRELVLYMPMEPDNYPRNNPGPATLTVEMTDGRIEQGLRRELDRTAPVVAVANLMGQFATRDEKFMTAVYRELRQARLPFLHVNPAPRAVCKSLASRVGAAYDLPDLVIDGIAERGDPKKLDAAWKDAVTMAHERGDAIVLLRVTPNSAPWLDRAFAAKRLEGAELVALTDVIRRPGTAD